MCARSSVRSSRPDRRAPSRVQCTRALSLPSAQPRALHLKHPVEQRQIHAERGHRLALAFWPRRLPPSPTSVSFSLRLYTNHSQACAPNIRIHSSPATSAKRAISITCPPTRRPTDFHLFLMSLQMTAFKRPHRPLAPPCSRPAILQVSNHLSTAQASRRHPSNRHH